jgi:hypothetical protein
MDGLRRWELEWLRERFPLRWREMVAKLVFPGEPVPDDPEYVRIPGGAEFELKFSFKLESLTVVLILTTGPDRSGALTSNDGLWSLDIEDVRKADPEGLADLIVDSYDVVVVMGS